MNLNRRFHHFARGTSNAIGNPRALVLALVMVIVWAVTGPLFQFSETWQLIINTGTTIATFLMLFPMQHSQNTDTTAMHAKLDMLIAALPQADNALVAIEQRDDDVESVRVSVVESVIDS